MQMFHFRNRFVQDVRLDLMGSLHSLICLSVVFETDFCLQQRRSLGEMSFSLRCLDMCATIGAMEGR